MTASYKVYATDDKETYGELSRNTKWWITILMQNFALNSEEFQRIQGEVRRVICDIEKMCDLPSSEIFREYPGNKEIFKKYQNNTEYLRILKNI